MGMSVLLGSRGVGAIVGALAGARITGAASRPLRISIAVGFLMGGLGYLGLSGAPTIWLACAALIVAHAGGSMIWTSSTTMLQSMTEDRFRGRVFSAEFAFSMFILAAASQVGGYLLDHGMPLRTLAFGTGIMFFIPALAWASIQHLWRPRV